MIDSKKFEGLVSTVAAEGIAGTEARQARQAAEAELLDRVLAMAWPALKVIGTRPVISYHVAHHADVNYYGGVTAEERFDFRCVPLSNGDFGPEEDCPRANEGRFEGKLLAVQCDNGHGHGRPGDEFTCIQKLVQFEYSGDWSRWQGSSWGWEAEVTYFDGAAEAIAAGWTKVDEYLERLQKQLEGAVGKRKDRANADRRRAEQLGAVVSLLKK